MKCNKISNRQKYASCISGKLFKFSVYELLKLRQYAISCCTCGNYNFLHHNNSSFDFSHLNIHKHMRGHTHTHARTHARTGKIKLFNENVRSNEDSGQIERDKLKYLHYLNKMIEKCKVRKSIFSEVSCF